MPRHRSPAAGLAATLCFLPARAQQPPHNDCSNAAPISPCGTATGSNVGASGDGSASCDISAWLDVWHSVAVPGNGTLSVYTCPASFDTVISVRPSCSAADIACNGNSSYCGTAYPLTSYVSVPVTGPRTYLIRVAGHGAATGTYILNTEFSLANDPCWAAIPIGETPLLGSTECATVDGSADCASGGPDVWYRYESKCSGTLNVFTCPASYDTLISVHSGCPGTIANQIACNDDSAYCGSAYPLTSHVAVPVIANRYYMIRVSGYNGATGTFVLNTHLNPVTPSNNDCANAIAVGDGDTPFQTCGATPDGLAVPIPCSAAGNGDIGPDIWYRYTAPCSGSAAVSLCNSNYDTMLAIYNAACPIASGQVIACNDNSCATRSFVLFPATAGQQYLIRIGGRQGAQGSGVLNITCTPAFCYPNCDESTTPPILNVNDFACFLNRFAAGEPYANCDSSTAAPVLNVNDFACFLNAFAAGCS